MTGLKLALVLALLATPALADKFSGQYTVAFFGPHHQQGGTVCYAFTPKGQTVPGFANSGTWVQIGNEGVGGDFVVTGHDLHFFGAVPISDNLLAYSFHASLNSGKGDYDLWLANTSPVTPEDDGSIVLTAGC